MLYLISARREESLMNLKNSALIVSASVVVALGAAAGLKAVGAANSGDAAIPAAIAAEYKPAAPIPFAGAPNYRAIVAANRAAVVGVTTESKGTDAADDGDEEDQGQGNGGQGNGRDNPFGDNPLFRFFQMPNQPR